ncbi:MAG: nucleotide-binding protein, partial [Nitrosopumilus sp.]|nr:nucleotide-binding protein [Nitrosopumilus sp.]
MSVKEQFIENAKDGKVLTHKCTSCGHLHLSTV